MKKITNKWFFAGLAVVAVLVGGVTAYANSTFFAPTAGSATASSTIVFMTPGTATTTVTYDSFNLSGTNQPVVNDPTAAQDAALLVQFTASSTSSVLGISFERSDDGVDWYQDNLSALATTSPTQSLQVPTSYSWTFASSTLNGVANTGNRVGKIITVPTPTRFTRAVITVTGANASIFARFIPNKQNK